MKLSLVFVVVAVGASNAFFLPFSLTKTSKKCSSEDLLCKELAEQCLDKCRKVMIPLLGEKHFECLMFS